MILNQFSKKKDMIIQYLRQYEKAQKKDFRKLLLDKLPDSMNPEQKEYKIGNLLSSMRKKGIIKTDSSNRQLGYWVLCKHE